MRSPDRSAWPASLRRLAILGLGTDYFRFARARHLLSRPSMCPCENARMDGLACPCGLGDDYALCCGRFHAGAPVPTAESLMRSATAHSPSGMPVTSCAPGTRHAARAPSTSTRHCGGPASPSWKRDGGLFDATGTVQFRAMYIQQGQRGVLAETSRFVRLDRHWTYLGPIG
jgi:SEC-C motif domain protein